MSALPRAVQPFIGFAALLRANGFSVAPEQTQTFLEAITLLGPKSIADIRRAGHAVLAPPAGRRPEFDALFDAHFLDAFTLGAMAGAETQEMRVQESGRGFDQPDLSGEINEAGQAAAGAEMLNMRALRAETASAAIQRLRRELPARAPMRRGFRFRRARAGARFDLRRSLRDAARHDGDVMALRRLKRRLRHRKFLLLIDVSGSMKQRTEEHLAIAHAAAQALERAEVFTFGTRLTRVTRALKLKQREQALAAASGAVSDWDGGTRIGDALQAFLAVPRFAGYARGAAVAVLSDGLEIGDPAAMRDAVAKLSRRAWRLSWLSPLAIGPGFKPETEALKAILPFLDELADGSGAQPVVDHLLSISKRRAA